jgi:surface antigen
MSSTASFFPIAAAGATAFALVAAVFVSAEFVWAAEPAGAQASATSAAAGCLCPKSNEASRLTDIRIDLDLSDEYAALESVQLALTEVPDGSSYVWHREGRMSGLVKPLSSFKSMRGEVCRHAVVVLSGPDSTKKTEIVACRLPTGVWQVQS